MFVDRRQVGLGDQRLQVLVVDLVFLVGQFLEAGEGVVEFLLGSKLDIEFGEPGTESVAPGVLAHHQAVGAPANVLRQHDFVSLAALEHAVLVDARLVGESVGANDRLVRLHREAGDSRDQPRAGHDLGGVEVGGAVEDVTAGAHRHDDLLEGGVAGALAEAVDGALDLACAVLHCGQGVGNRQAEVVVAMDREDRPIGVGDALDQLVDQVAELGRYAVPDRIRNVDRGRAGIDHRLEDAAEEILFRTTGVLG